LISRVADHCFWFGRYTERSESTARVLSVTKSLALDAELSPAQCWLPVVIVSGERAAFESSHGPEAAAEGEVVEAYMTWADENLTSIRSSVSFARENARSIREVVSLEAWETINELYLFVIGGEGESLYRQNRYEFYRKIRQAAQLCLGLLRSTMLHDTPLDFIWLGVLLERVGQTARILDVHHHAFSFLPPIPDSSARAARHEVTQTALWLGLLRACSGFEPFMKRNQGHVSGDAVASFLVLEKGFPRSVRYCVRSAYERFCAIRPPEDKGLPGGQTLERLRVLDEWLSSLREGELHPRAVHEVLTHVVDEIAEICTSLAREMFGYGLPPIEVASQTQPQSAR
jgi:uncharacterized alpha-E superfamily protein